MYQLGSQTKKKKTPTITATTATFWINIEISSLKSVEIVYLFVCTLAQAFSIYWSWCLWFVFVLLVCLCAHVYVCVAVILFAPYFRGSRSLLTVHEMPEQKLIPRHVWSNSMYALIHHDVNQPITKTSTLRRFSYFQTGAQIY